MRKFFDRSGEVSSLDLFAALCDVGREGKSGTVRFKRNGEAIALHFREGVLSGLEAPETLSPGAILVRSGKLQRPTFDGLIVGEGEDRFSVAVSSGVVSKKEAFWGRKIASIEALSRLLSWGDGEYEYESSPPAEEAGGFRLPIDKWILELFLRSNDRPLVMHQLGATDLPLVKADYFASAFAALGLTADADAVAGSIDGKRTIEQIVRRAPAEEFAVLKLLAALVTLGLVRPALEEPFPPLANAGLELASVEPEPVDQFPDPDEELPDATMMVPTMPEPEAPPEPFVEEVFPASPPPAPIALPEEAIPIAEEVASVPLFALTAPERSEGEAFSPEASLDDESPPPEEPPRRRVGGALVFVAVLALAAAAGYLWKTRSARSISSPPVSAPPARPVAETSPPASVAAPPRSIPLPSVSPKKIDVEARAAKRVSVEPKSASRPAPPPPKVATKEKTPVRTAAAKASWEGRLVESQKEFEHPGVFRYSVQLELACEGSTVEKALSHDAGGQKIWIVPTEYRGRTCYRILWGRFKSLDTARAAKAEAPAYFTAGGNRPAIVSLGSSDRPRNR